ncbi:Pre-tRNA-processing protein PTA1 [Nakaseomyces glabratus]|nr:Pre-tRNA-processing protein PTA1 [Nakaseomyces glabratus]KTB26445.1 Pre-tRNA-processing protein PTA1 [Nakaseomyces glabratus]
MNESDIDQLYKARELALNKSPEKTLPKVLETAESLYLAADSNADQAIKHRLSKFLTHVFYEILTSELIPKNEKPFIASQHLHTIMLICRDSQIDPVTYKYAILSLTSSYSSLFDLVAKTSNQELWDTMQELKSFIITRWRTPYPKSKSNEQVDDSSMLAQENENIGCKLATLKLISEVIIVQTPIISSSTIKDKSGHMNMISLASVPDNHPVISKKQVYESEAKKLLDSLLNYLVEQPFMISMIFVAIINCLAIVMKQRPQTTIRILSGLLRFNVDAKFQMDNQSTVNYRLAKRFVERAYKNFVQYGLKGQYIKNTGTTSTFYTKLSKISQTLHVIGEEAKSKGILNFDANEVEHYMNSDDRNKAIAQIKRLRSSIDDLIKAQMLTHDGSSLSNNDNNAFDNMQSSNIANGKASSSESIDDMHFNEKALQLSELQKYTMSKNNMQNFFNSSTVALDNSYSSVYSLMNSKNSDIDMSKLPSDLLLKLCSEAVFNTDTKKMLTGLSIVASRYSDLMNKYKTKKRRMEDDEMAERLNKRLRGEEVDEPMTNAPKVEEKPKEKVEEMSEASAINKSNDSTYTIEPEKLNENEKEEHFKRIISNIMDIKKMEETPEISSFVNTKLKPLQKIKLMQWNSSESWLHILTRLATRGVNHDENMSNIIRQTLYDYFLDNFNDRASVALEWLNEEWYNETINKSKKENGEESYKNYDEWSLKLLDGLVPSLENQHRRLFIRLMSELPRVTYEHILKLRSVCLDPARSSLGFQVLKFLVMFRPPTKPYIKEFLEKLKQEDSTIEKQCNSILDKYCK